MTEANTEMTRPAAKRAQPARDFRAIMARLRHKRMAGTASPIERVPRDGSALPLASTQQRLWFIEQLQPGTAAYNIGTGVRLRGELDPAILHAAFAYLVKRHESLRTSFVSRDGEPVQVIAPEVDLGLPLVDLSALTGAEGGRAEQEMRGLVAELRHRPFDLERPPLLRLALVCLAPRDHVLIHCQHHLVTDGWSTSVLIRELADLYRALIEGSRPQLPELPIQFADYAAWQRRTQTESAMAPHLEFWRRQLEGAPAVLELPSDRPRPPARTHRGSRHDLGLRPGLAEDLGQLARRHDTTLFVVLLAAFQTLLHRWSGQADLVVGTPIANRSRGELRHVLGYFANTLALRVNLADRPSFRDLLERLQGWLLEAHQHQELPFERLVEELQPERNPGHTPLFQVVFAFQNVPMPRLELPGLTFEWLSIGAGTSTFDITFLVEQEGDGRLNGWVEYSTDLFDHPTMMRFGAHFRKLLETLGREGRGSVADLPLMGASERHQVMVEWNDTERAESASKPLDQFFEDQVERTPEAVALVFGDEQLSYRELDRRANRLARHLVGLGVGPEVRVGLALERSAERVMAILAIVKAAGVYLPLELDYPSERLRFILDDACEGMASPVIVTRQPLLGRWPAERSTAVLLDRDGPAISGRRATAPPTGAGGENLLYVMYTSGSTGRPKGTAVPHRAVARLVCEPGYVDLRPGETFLQLSSISFDASTFELWGALLNGARLVIPPPGVSSLEELGRQLEEHGVTTLWLTAGLFHQMVDSRLAALGGLRQLLAGGDVLSVPHVRRVLEELPGCRLVNGYGPTENTTFTCCRRITPGDGRRASIPIGRPIHGTRIHVLDGAGRPVPLGVVGELHAGGDGLARGYLDRPALTAEKFVPDPLASRPGTRLYRTGDLARRRADSTALFFGRRDFQVKLRGYRIELGEIENALLRHPAVRAAVAMALADDSAVPGATDKRLVAYVVFDAGAPPLAELRQYLREDLPGYMVPAAVVALEEMPLNPNGKLDRAALPRPEVCRDDLSTAFVAPRGAIEQELEAVWRETLKVDQVGVHDNFFELGGHSLLALELLGRVRQALDVELPVGTLFEQPTIAALAEAVGRALRSSGAAASAVPALRPVSRERPLPLSYSQLRFWLRRPAEGRVSASNTPFAARLAGPLDVTALARSLQHIVDRHEILRTNFREISGEPHQVVCPARRLALPVVDLGALEPERREAELMRLGRQATRVHFDAARDLLLRATLVRLVNGSGESEEHALFLVKDHMITDGWSESVFADELAAGYEAFSRGRRARLPDLPVQYGDYAVWQRALVDSFREELLAYWLKRLDQGRFQVFRPPTDFPRPEVRSLAGARCSLCLAGDLSRALQDLGHGEHASPFITLLAAFKVLLQQWTGQDDIALTTNTAHRGSPETERLIGLFTNLLVLRTDLGERPSFRQVLRRVRRTTLEAYAHQDLPFFEILQALRPGRPHGINELFPVGLVMQNVPFRTLTLPGLELRPIEVGSGGSPRDLLLFVLPEGERMRIALAYRTDLFRRATIEELLVRFEKLLRAVVTHPDRPLSELEGGSQ